jgi:PEP-CTERM motif
MTQIKKTTPQQSGRTKMTGTIQKLLIGASMVVGVGAIASTPAIATTLKPTNIEFGTYNGLPQIETYLFKNTPEYEMVNGVNRQKLGNPSRNNTVDAIAALTDDSAATNVEIWYGSETPQRVGFTANLGTNTLKVESVTKADWVDGVLATAWLNGFRNAYSGLMGSIATTGGSNLLNDFNTNFNSLVGHLKTNGFDTAGDPNIGAVTYNEQTGKLQVDLVGHLDVAGRYVDTRRQIRQSGQMRSNSNFIENFSTADGRYTGNAAARQGFSPDYARNSTGNLLLDSALIAMSTKSYRSGQALQISEIAKITFNGEVSYAFGFNATDSGAIAGNRNVINDSTSHTGIYTWTKDYGAETVPEPSTILGLMAIGGLVAAKRKSLKKA